MKILIFFSQTDLVHLSTSMIKCLISLYVLMQGKVPKYTCTCTDGAEQFIHSSYLHCTCTCVMNIHVHVHVFDALLVHLHVQYIFAVYMCMYMSLDVHACTCIYSTCTYMYMSVFLSFFPSQVLSCTYVHVHTKNNVCSHIYTCINVHVFCYIIGSVVIQQDLLEDHVVLMQRFVIKCYTCICYLY